MPLATLAADWPPTNETTVLDCVPVASPARLPVKLAGAAAPMSVHTGTVGDLEGVAGLIEN